MSMKTRLILSRISRSVAALLATSCVNIHIVALQTYTKRTDAAVGQFPFNALVEINLIGESFLFCGGSLFFVQ